MYEIGYKACYIQDYSSFKHLCTIPPEVAIEWVRQKCPDIYMGGCLAKDLTLNGKTGTDAKINGWLNKLFVVVANDHCQSIALVNWDGRFSVYLSDNQEIESDS